MAVLSEVLVRSAAATLGILASSLGAELAALALIGLAAALMLPDNTEEAERAASAAT